MRPHERGNFHRESINALRSSIGAHKQLVHESLFMCALLLFYTYKTYMREGIFLQKCGLVCISKIRGALAESGCKTLEGRQQQQQQQPPIINHTMIHSIALARAPFFAAEREIGKSARVRETLREKSRGPPAATGASFSFGGKVIYH